MAKIVKARVELTKAIMRLSRITDDTQTSIFHQLNIGSADLDEYTLGVVRDRLRRYLDTWVLPSLDDAEEFLRS